MRRERVAYPETVTLTEHVMVHASPKARTRNSTFRCKLSQQDQALPSPETLLQLGGRSIDLLRQPVFRSSDMSLFGY